MSIGLSVPDVRMMLRKFLKIGCIANHKKLVTIKLISAVPKEESRQARFSIGSYIDPSLVLGSRINVNLSFSNLEIMVANSATDTIPKYLFLKVRTTGDFYKGLICLGYLQLIQQ